MNRFALPSIVLALACGSCSLATSAGAQVLVYKIEFKHLDGFNVDFYQGGYLIAPALGGDGTFLLTAIEGGRRVLDTSPGSGRFFFGNSSSKRYNGVAATVGGGEEGTTAGGAYVAYGTASSTVTLRTPLSRLKLKLAKTLHGQAVAANDEEGENKLNGSVGSANLSEMTLRLDEGLTETYNGDGLSVADAAARVTTLLIRQGWAVPAAPTPPTTPGTDNGGVPEGGTDPENAT